MHFRYMIAGVLGILLAGGASIAAQAAEQQDLKATPKGVRITPDVVYGHKYGMALTIDVYRPKKQNGAGVIWINSGGYFSIWAPRYKRTATSLRYLTREELVQLYGSYTPRDINHLLSRGFTIYEVRHGSSPKFDMADIVGDLRRAVRFIRFYAHEFGVDAERLGLWGGSSGGHLALLLGTTAEVGIPQPTDQTVVPHIPEEYERESGHVAAVVAISAPSVLPNIPALAKQFPVMDVNEEQRRQFFPLYFASSDDPPTLIIHGDKDTVVPIFLGEIMYQALLKAGAKTKFVKIPGGGHGSSGFSEKDADLIDKEIVNWFGEHLKVK